MTAKQVFSRSFWIGTNAELSALTAAEDGSFFWTTDSPRGLWVFSGGSWRPSNVGEFPENHDVYTTTWQSYGGSSTIVGWSSFTTTWLAYQRLGRFVRVFIDLRGTSDNTVTTFTLPYLSASGSTLQIPIRIRDNGNYAVGLLSLQSSSGTVACYATISAGVWTNSGTKEVHGEFWYYTTDAP